MRGHDQPINLLITGVGEGKNGPMVPAVASRRTLPASTARAIVAADTRKASASVATAPQRCTSNPNPPSCTAPPRPDGVPRVFVCGVLDRHYADFAASGTSSDTLECLRARQFFLIRSSG